MAEGGHDPEFDLVDSDEEAMPAFASLIDLERYLPLTLPRSDPWSIPDEPAAAVETSSTRCSCREEDESGLQEESPEESGARGTATTQSGKRVEPP